MKFKLDENFGRRTLHLFLSAGHDVQTTSDENMQGCSDRHLYEVCVNESRCLVTMDLDFSDVTRFPPDQSAGIAVVRIPHNPTLTLLEQSIRLFLTMLIQTPIENNLWIVETTRIRIHQSEKN
jgi:predicted nuclease of predicted toxin-antitoxin system